MQYITYAQVDEINAVIGQVVKHLNDTYEAVEALGRLSHVAEVGFPLVVGALFVVLFVMAMLIAMCVFVIREFGIVRVLCFVVAFFLLFVSFVVYRYFYPVEQIVYDDPCAFRWTWFISSYSFFHDGCYNNAYKHY